MADEPILPDDAGEPPVAGADTAAQPHADADTTSEPAAVSPVAADNAAKANSRQKKPDSRTPKYVAKAEEDRAKAEEARTAAEKNYAATLAAQEAITKERLAIEERLRALGERTEEIAQSNAELDELAKMIQKNTEESTRAHQEMLKEITKREESAREATAKAEATLREVEQRAAQLLQGEEQLRRDRAALRAQQAQQSTQQPHPQFGAAANGVAPHQFSPHDLEVFAAYRPKYINLIPDAHQANDVHKGFSLFHPHTDPSKPPEKRAIEVRPEGIKVHTPDDDNAMKEAILLAVQRHKGNFWTIDGTATPGMKQRILKLTQEMYAAGELVDHKNPPQRISPITFNGFPIDGTAPAQTVGPILASSPTPPTSAAPPSPQTPPPPPSGATPPPTFLSPGAATPPPAGPAAPAATVTPIVPGPRAQTSSTTPPPVQNKRGLRERFGIGSNRPGAAP